MTKKLWILTLIIFAMGSNLIASHSDYLYKINRSFELYGAVFKELTNTYADEIDPDSLSEYAIKGMLKKLDPYTTYYTEEESEDLDMLATETYVGLGISISVVDSLYTISYVREGFSADKAGLRVGDRIVKADSVFVKQGDGDGLRRFTRGKVGTILNLSILRDGIKDTLDFALERELIKINSLVHSEVLDSNIAYFKLDRFSMSSNTEIKKKLNYFLKHNDIKGIIIDVRNNPGGLLNAAVNISDYFLPKGQLIVKTKNRYTEIPYYSRGLGSKSEQELPLAILINEGSASASEVLAGAIQDTDRGIVVGRKSFGKGLVQSIVSLPYNKNLKLTTAKYYTPSGRCIQKKDYGFLNIDQLRENNGHDSIFYTSNGREIFERNGIFPDTTIEKRKYPNFINEWVDKHYFFTFANEYSSSIDSLKEGIEIDDSIIKDFSDYLLKQESFNDLNQKYKDLLAVLEKEGLEKKYSNKLKFLSKEANSLLLKKIKKNEETIKEILAWEINKRLLKESSLQKILLQDDRVVNTTISILKSQDYKKILTANK